ncbi:MAG: replication-associated recombination protein A [Candidatus Omnitrophota bacterium]|jgi:putative ATPase
MFAAAAGPAPLAARMRPRTLDEVAGQQHLLAPGKPLRVALEGGQTGSILFWGPPGTGKTTLARLAAIYLHGEFVPFSAVSEGVPRLREIVDAAHKLRDAGRRTILFVDEIHRFNKGQQDYLLPHAESGLLTLIGATTENPSFELNGALLSRLRVFVLQPLSPDDIKGLVTRALTDSDRGLGALNVTIDDDALEILARESDGDARRALTVLEAAVLMQMGGGRGEMGDSAGAPISLLQSPIILDALQRRFAQYDKSGEGHYNTISAYHKALRGSDPQGALYWLARMIEGGEDPMYIARRTVRFASEDVGLADPRALQIAIAARDAYHFLGSPEGELALAEAAVYLATAPKSNRVYAAWGAALEAARETPAAQVPLPIRNAPTKLMKELGYGAGYSYAHSVPEGYTPQDYLPDELASRTFYKPTEFGFEKEISKRLEWWARIRETTEKQQRENRETTDE